MSPTGDRCSKGILTNRLQGMIVGFGRLPASRQPQAFVVGGARSLSPPSQGSSSLSPALIKFQPDVGKDASDDPVWMKCFPGTSGAGKVIGKGPCMPPEGHEEILKKKTSTRTRMLSD